MAAIRESKALAEMRARSARIDAIVTDRIRRQDAARLAEEIAEIAARKSSEAAKKKRLAMDKRNAVKRAGRAAGRHPDTRAARDRRNAVKRDNRLWLKA